jgi:hypothetical protein
MHSCAYRHTHWYNNQCLSHTLYASLPVAAATLAGSYPGVQCEGGGLLEPD